MRKKEELLIAWVKGYYSLGWRGWLAMKLLNPIIRESLTKEIEK